MTPPDKSSAVARALREAFGVSEADEIHVIKDLASSMVYRIVVRGTPYILKISTRGGDPTCHFACMKAAAEASLAPRVVYTNVDDRVSITDFIQTAPLPREDALVRIPAVLRELHALPRFPKQHFNTTCTFLLDKGPALDGFIEKIKTSSFLSSEQRDEFFARFEQLATAYPRPETDIVSSHNDLFKPDNMLFDGRRVWLIDWEAAFQNDRYADLAVVANMIVCNDAEEGTYLQEYFGRPPDESQQARFYVARQLAHLFYAAGFLMLGSAGKSVDWSEPIPTYYDFQRRFWSGAIKLDDNPTKIVYGRVHWERLQHNVQQQRYQEALRIVSDLSPRRDLRMQAS